METICVGCRKYYANSFCSYVAFNKLNDPIKFRNECVCSTCIVKVTCQDPCDKLSKYFDKWIWNNKI